MISVAERAVDPVTFLISIDIETGDYETDDVGIESARRLQAKHPEAATYGVCIGYDAACSLGGVWKRESRHPACSRYGA